MIFSDSDLKPNPPIRLDQVRVGNTSDARWRIVPPEVQQIDALNARPPLPCYNIKGK